MWGTGKKTAQRPRSRNKWSVFLSTCIITEKALDLGPESAIYWLCNLGPDQLASLFLNFLIFKIGDEAFIIFHNCNENEIKQLNEDDDDIIKANIPLALGIVCKHLGAIFVISQHQVRGRPSSLLQKSGLQSQLKLTDILHTDALLGPVPSSHSEFTRTFNRWNAGPEGRSDLS